MQEWLINKKLVIIFVILAGVLSAAVFGARFAASYYYKKGAQAYLQNNFSAAKNSFNNSLIFYSKNSRAHFWLGKIALGLPAPKQNVYWPQADYGEAVNHYEKAVSLGLEQKNRNLYIVVLEDLGGAYWNLNKLDKAREKYSEKLSKFPESSFWARYFIALDDFNRLNKPEEALEILPPALDLVASDNDRFNLFKVHALLALLNLYFEDYNNVKKHAELAIESAEPQNEGWEIQTAHALLALNYGIQKKFTLVESEIKKAGGFDCFLAVSYAAGKNYSKAISIAEASDKIADDYINSVCLRVLAVSYLARGDKIKAKQYMEEYLSFTEKLSDKNIFVMRNRQEFADELLKLK